MICTVEEAVLLLDDLLLAPFRGLLFVLREIDKAVQAERAAEQRRVMAELADLYRQIEAGELSDDEFAASEERLLERLERLRAEDDGDADHDARG